MPSTFFGLDIAASGMQTYQNALNTTSHNISNIGTLGYTKQTTLRTANQPISLSSTYGMVGTGVRVTDIVQNRSVYYDNKYRYNSTVHGNYVTKDYYMSCIEDYLFTLDKDGGGVYNSYNNFFGALSDLTGNAANETKRDQAITYADTFTASMNDLANSLQTLQTETNFEIKVVADQINALGIKIASLTQQINSIEIYGQTANDLRDARNVLIDELSEFVHVSVTETEPAEGVGNRQYIVRIAGDILVDTSQYRQLEMVPSETRVHQNDVGSLYGIRWNDGQDFAIRNTALGGKLQALLEVRDGNNEESFKGKITASATGLDHVTKVTIEDANINNIFKLNIPESGGLLTIGGVEYEYDSFEVKVESDGSYTYTFSLKGVLSNDKKLLLDSAVTKGRTAQIGDSVAYKGIPYYMSLLNEFVRTFSSSFNSVHNNGYDLNGDSGLDLFNSIDKVTGENYTFAEKGADGNYYMDGALITQYSFSSVIQPNGTGTYVASYYSMNALNFAVNKEMKEDMSKLALASQSGNGVDNGENLERLYNVKSDEKMFLQGTAEGFLEILVSSAGVEGQKANSAMKSQENILKTIDNRRISVSGVDEDEEAADLVKFQNLLFFQYKVLSIMNEVYDKLINGTAV